MSRPPTVDTEHLRGAIADAAELARQEPGGLAAFLRELGRAWLAAGRPAPAEPDKQERRSRA